MTKVMGYADRQSVRPGETVRFMISVLGGGDYDAQVVRLHSPEVGTGPDVPELREVGVETSLTGRHHTDEQELRVGSFARLLEGEELNELRELTLMLRLQVTLEASRPQIVASTLSDGEGFELAISPDGGLVATIGHGEGAEPTRVEGPRVPTGQWVSVGLAVDGRAQSVRLVAKGVERRHDVLPRSEAARKLAAGFEAGRAPLLLAAGGAGEDGKGTVTRDHFNGRIERPRILGVALTAAQLDEAMRTPWEESTRRSGDDVADAVLGDWAFERDMSSNRVVDRSAGASHGVLFNMPTRAVRSSGWSGTNHDWRSAPEEYAAIHFHEDDIHEAGWNPNHELVVPDGWQSGCYALRLRSGGSEFYVPFFVRPPVATTTADIVLLISTATYAAYANMHLRVTARFNELIHGRLTVLDETDLLLLEVPELGRSTYDSHVDGSPVVYSSMRRPVTNFRPKGRIYKFCQDLLIVDWLEQAGFSFDVVTDEDLHREGAVALDGYRVVVTSSHPEYYSKEMLDVLDGFVTAGGRLAYLGGNGFWVRAEYHPEVEGVVEVRRPGGGLLWPTGSTERFFSFTGEPGGWWDDLGRNAQHLCGVGFVTQGFDRSSYYHRTRESRDPRAAFIFEGIDDEIIGDFGLLQEGAAGYEIDVYDRASGSPAHGLVVASSERHSNLYTIMTKSVLDAVPDPRPDAKDPIRADMVFFETPGGGAVFSVGSIAWSGSLAHANYENNVARVTGNVLRRFVDPAPFPMPDE